ncbi:MAG: phage tail protein [Treponema sp.]|jgi:phage tail-like protein|nr:phage tail protein [Treponema sp.]
MADYMPTTKTYFKVEIDQISYTNFISVSGLDATADVSDDMGGLDKNPRKVIGKVKYNTVKLVRNADIKDKLLRDWWKTVEDGNPEPRSVSVVFMSRDGKEELTRRNLFNAVPCGWGISDLSSTENGLNTETISIVYESAEWK